MTEVLAAQHLGHTALDLVGFVVAAACCVMAVVVAVVLDRRAEPETTPRRAAEGRTER